MQVLEKSGVAEQMKTWGLWADWESGKRGEELIHRFIHSSFIASIWGEDLFPH
jgi:hypothetical protein